jgi:hypothetical protein
MCTRRVTAAESDIFLLGVVYIKISYFRFNNQQTTVVVELSMQMLTIQIAFTNVISG